MSSLLINDFDFVVNLFIDLATATITTVNTVSIYQNQSRFRQKISYLVRVQPSGFSTTFKSRFLSLSLAL